MASNARTTDRALLVFMNGLLIGHLRKSAEGGISFQYDNTWLTTPDNYPISLHLPLEPSRHSGDVVYNFFDNLLPDNPAVRTHIQQRFKVKSSHPFDLLEAIGKVAARHRRLGADAARRRG